MLFFIICSCSQTRSSSKAAIVKIMSQTPYLYKFSNSQQHERNHFTFFFLPVGLAVLINLWQKTPSPETFHFLFWLSLFRGCYIHCMWPTQLSGYKQANWKPKSYSLLWLALHLSKKTLSICLDQTRVYECLISLPPTELPNTIPSLPFSAFSTHMTTIK